MTRPSRPQPPARYIYVIGPREGLQKVGMATDPRTRLAALQTASPVDLMVHASIAVPFAAAPDVERQAHRMLARVCVRNEWFKATPAEAVAAVYAAALPWMDKPKPSSGSGAPVHPSPAEWRIGRADRVEAAPPPGTTRPIAAVPLPRGSLSVELLPLFRGR